MYASERRLATLGGELHVRALPHGPGSPPIMASGQARRHRCPQVALRRERTAVGACALEQGVDVLSSHAECAADAYRRQDTLVDPVADGLGGDLELLGDLGNSEEVSLSRGQGSVGLLQTRS